MNCTRIIPGVERKGSYFLAAVNAWFYEKAKFLIDHDGQDEIKKKVIFKLLTFLCLT